MTTKTKRNSCLPAKRDVTLDDAEESITFLTGRIAQLEQQLRDDKKLRRQLVTLRNKYLRVGGR